MYLSAEDMVILHAALLVVLQGDEDAWEDLTQEELERASALLAQLDCEGGEGEDYDEDAGYDN